MADSFDNLWVDSTFIDISTGHEDTLTDFVAADSDNIGKYTMPVVYGGDETFSLCVPTTVQCVIGGSTDGFSNIYNEYYVRSIPIDTALLTSLVEYTTKVTVSGIADINTVYHTSYNTISGSKIAIVNYTGGNEFYECKDNHTVYIVTIPVSGTLDLDTLYTNFSGNQSEPVPTTCINNEVFYTTVSGISNCVNAFVDISLAGWVEFLFPTEVFATAVSANANNFETIIIDGGLVPHYFDVYSSVSGTIQLCGDLYSSIENYFIFDFECSTISGGLYQNYWDLYSTIDSKNELLFNVDLLSLKIDNFSLEVGQYTDVTNAISVDILDDECPVSVSGTYLEVDGQIVSTTMSGITDGYRMFYDPVDDYASLLGPTTFTVHAENECSIVLEQDIYLTFGYIVEFDNSDPPVGIDYGFNNKVAVRVTAEDFASCPTTNAMAFDFDSVDRRSTDLSASITGIESNFGEGLKNLNASISPISTAYFYDKEFRIVVNAKDFAGNAMETLLLTYKIESKP